MGIIEHPMGNIEPRLAAVRERLTALNYDALIVPRADEHLGEYIPEDKERLHWLTGFTGSAGAAIVTADEAAIFIDGRYTVQVRGQVPASSFSYCHLITEPQSQWLIDRLPAGARVACDPRLHSLQWFSNTRAALERSNILLVADSDNVIDQCWQDRPAAIVREALLLDEHYSGESSRTKRERIAALIAAQGGDAALIFPPDSVSWLLNVRGLDMPQLPVLQSFAFLDTQANLTLFVDEKRLPAGFESHVGTGVTVCSPEDAPAFVSKYAGQRVLADRLRASAWIQLLLEDAGAVLQAADDPTLLPKACKNAAELAGARAAHLRDAVAEVRFLCWLDEEIEQGRLHDEEHLSQQLLSYRSEGEHFHACSFDTISAAGSNAAMCHYNHLNGEPATLPMNSLYLVDSGGQYTDGTTDITRTVAIGDPGAESRKMFTLVLKGHIALDQARFPHGTTGTQLDGFARQFLWQAGYDYDHGTGHGVGAFLSVHEGPQRISKAGGDVALQPGMIVSNEPGYYRDGQFGIRCENLVTVIEIEDSQGEVPLLGFEALTLVPFDTRLIDLALLTESERQWINDYHRRVLNAVGPLVFGNVSHWLAEATREI